MGVKQIQTPMNYWTYLATSLDYMYYRTARAYFKWDKKQGVSAIFNVALFLSAIGCFSCIAFFRWLLGEAFFIEYDNLIKTIIVGVSLLILFLSFKRYWNSFDKLHDRFKDEQELTRKWKGVIIVIVYIIPWAIMVIASYCG